MSGGWGLSSEGSRWPVKTACAVIVWYSRPMELPALAVVEDEGTRWLLSLRWGLRRGAAGGLLLLPAAFFRKNRSLVVLGEAFWLDWSALEAAGSHEATLQRLVL